MSNLSQKKRNSKWTILGIGTGGAAKSPAFASWAVLGDLKLFNFDGESRLDPIIDFYTNVCPRPDILQNIDYTNVGTNNFEDFLKDFEKLQDDCRWTTVMVDSITSASVTCLTWQLWKRGKIKDVRPKLSGGEVGIPVPDWPEFNGEASFLMGLLEIGKTIPANFIVTAHPLMRTKVEGKGKNITGSNYESLVSAGIKGVDLIPNYFNEIWKLGIDVSYSSEGAKTRRTLQAYKEVSDDLAKNTCGLPEKLIDFTNRPLYEVIKEELDKKGRVA